MAPVGDRRHNGVLFVPQLLKPRISIDCTIAFFFSSSTSSSSSSFPLRGIRTCKNAPKRTSPFETWVKICHLQQTTQNGHFPLLPLASHSGCPPKDGRPCVRGRPEPTKSAAEQHPDLLLKGVAKGRRGSAGSIAQHPSEESMLTLPPSSTTIVIGFSGVKRVDRPGTKRPR